MKRTLIAALLALTATACTPDRHPAPPIPVAIATPSQYSCGTAPGFCPNPPTPIEAATCHIVDGKADRRCTPGALNPDVTQANIGITICRPGWTDTVRPPLSYTNRLKAAQMARYGESGPIGNYREDHLVSLEVGGAPRAPSNLFPQLYADSIKKDADERAAHAAICAGRITLKQGQDQLLAKWSR